MALFREGTLGHNLFYTDANVTTAFCKRGCTLIGEGFRSERALGAKLAEIVLKTVIGIALVGIGLALFVASATITGFIQLGWLTGATSRETRYGPSGASHLPRQGRRIKYEGNGKWQED